MDLVEQLYGADLSVKSVNIDLTDSIVLPTPPKNKALDIATWQRRSSSLPATPHGSSSMSSPPMPHPAHRSQILFSSRGSSPGMPPENSVESLSLEEYSNRMEAAAIMLAQLNANLIKEPVTNAFGEKPLPAEPATGVLSWIPGSGWITGTNSQAGIAPDGSVAAASTQLRMRLQPSEAAAIRKKIMEEMMALEEERMARMKDAEGLPWASQKDRSKTSEDEGIVRRELSKVDPSATVFQEPFAAKKARIRINSQYGHLANWDVSRSCVLPLAMLNDHLVHTRHR